MSHLDEIDDPSSGSLHDFRKILVIPTAVLSDCDTGEDITFWAGTKEASLRRFLVLENGIPSEETDARKSGLRFTRKGAAWNDRLRERMLDIRPVC